eukprot:2682520-Pleurochrysis_carterae.AAC.1
MNCKPQPLTSIVPSPFSIGATADETGRHVMPKRFALFSRAFLMRSTCCLFLRTFSGSGPGQRGSR